MPLKLVVNTYAVYYTQYACQTIPALSCSYHCRYLVVDHLSEMWQWKQWYQRVWQWWWCSLSRNCRTPCLSFLTDNSSQLWRWRRNCLIHLAWALQWRVSILLCGLIVPKSSQVEVTFREHTETAPQTWNYEFTNSQDYKAAKAAISRDHAALTHLKPVRCLFRQQLVCPHNAQQERRRQSKYDKELSTEKLTNLKPKTS